MSRSAAGTGLSLRDPDASISVHGDRVIRSIRPHARAAFADILSRDAVRRLIESGSIVATTPLDHEDAPAGLAIQTDAIYEHERIPFASYPCEWSPAMLACAAEHTLQIALALLPQGLILKDATPANILFRGSSPVLVDVPSIVPRPAGQFLWYAREQFDRCFILPLVAAARLGIPLAWTLQDTVHGLNHAQLARIAGWRRWLRPSLIGTVAIPASLGKLGSTSGVHAPRHMTNDDQARYTLERTFRSLLATVRSLSREIDRTATSAWQRYTQTRSHYNPEDLDRKRRFVSEMLDAHRPETVLDIGANTGEFSKDAARHARVVAIDTDDASVNNIFREARQSRHDILPLVVNFARPTPAFGWSNVETASFMDRCSGSFDFVLALAVIHHLRITEGIPVAEVMTELARVTRKHLLIEFVPPADPMFRQLARGREQLYGDCERSEFEAALQRNFAIQSACELSNGRVLFMVCRKG